MAVRFNLKQDFSETVNYIIPQYPIYIRRAVLSEYHNYSAVSHWHEDIEFIYILSGEMQYDVNGEIVTIHEKEGIIINSRNFHYGYSETRKECEFICIIIHPSLFSGNNYVKEKYITPFLECIELPYILLTNEDWHKQILQDIYSLHSLNQSEESFFLKSQVFSMHIFEIIYENTKDRLHEYGQNSNYILMRLREMVHYIQVHYSEALSLENIAKVGKMGKTSCTTVFKTYMHTTPIEYLITFRMAQSVSLLTETDKSITEIAHAVGFTDSSYYSKYFKKYYGITPRNMRKQARG